MAVWSSSYVTALPDSAFACVNSTGRHYPHHDAQGKLDLPHLRAALSRIGDAANEQCGKGHLAAHASAADVGTKAAMPESPEAMRAHLEADPPEGHGADVGEMDMPQMQARHASLHESDAGHDHSMMGAEPMKAEAIGTSKWRVLAIPFGGPLKGGKDLDGEYFDAETDIKARWFRERPVLFHHGLDSMLKDADLGTEELDDEPTAEGWWATVWLDRAKRYWEQVNALLQAGKMYGSSGAIAHLVRKDTKTGHIEVWPHAEQTFTPTPANPYARITASKALAGFEAAGIAMADPIRSILAELDRLADDLRPDLPEPGEALVADLDEGGDDAASKRADVPASLTIPDPLMAARIALAETRLGLVRRRL